MADGFLGTIKWFDHIKGYGFIIPDNKTSDRDVFVHISALHRANLPEPREGQRVLFSTYDDRGRIAANILQILG